MDHFRTKCKLVMVLLTLWGHENPVYIGQSVDNAFKTEGEFNILLTYITEPSVSRIGEKSFLSAGPPTTIPMIFSVNSLNLSRSSVMPDEK